MPIEDHLEQLARMGDALGVHGDHPHLQLLSSRPHIGRRREPDVKVPLVHHGSALGTHFLVADVYNRGLDGVDLALLAIGDVSRHLEDKSPFLVGLAFALGHELTEPGRLPPEESLVILKEAVVALPLPTVEEEWLSHDAPGDPGVSHWPTEKVAGLGNDSNGVSWQIVGLVQGNLDLELWLAILGHLELGAKVIDILVGRLDAIVSQGSLLAQPEITIDSAHIADRERAAPGLSVLGVKHRDRDLRADGGKAVARIIVFTQDRLETHCLAGAIDESVGVEIRAIVLAPVGHRHTEFPGTDSSGPVLQDGGHPVAAPGQDDERLPRV